MGVFTSGAHCDATQVEEEGPRSKRRSLYTRGEMDACDMEEIYAPVIPFWPLALLTSLTPFSLGSALFFSALAQVGNSFTDVFSASLKFSFEDRRCERAQQ